MSACGDRTCIACVFIPHQVSGRVGSEEDCEKTCTVKCSIKMVNGYNENGKAEQDFDLCVVVPCTILPETQMWLVALVRGNR